MPIRSLALALALATALPVFTAPSPLVAEEQTIGISLAELMKVTSLDEVFVSFGETIAESPEAQGLPVNDQFLRAWKGAAADNFAPDQLQAALVAALEGQLSDAERAELGQFFRTPLGLQVSTIEAAAQRLSPDDQLAARDEGLALLEAAAPDARRPAQIDEIMALVSAEIGRTMLGEAMRAMMAGILLSGAQGDIEVPWDEIDAQLEMLLPGLEAEVLASQRGIMAYAYQELSDAQVDDYIAFLRLDAARKFYALAGYSIGLVVHDAMSQFGEDFASRMQRVGV